MDENTRELIVLLGTRIGMVMEDTCAIALTLGRSQPPDLDRHIDVIIAAVNRITRLAEALDRLRQ